MDRNDNMTSPMTRLIQLLLLFNHNKSWQVGKNTDYYVLSFHIRCQLKSLWLMKIKFEEKQSLNSHGMRPTAAVQIGYWKTKLSLDDVRQVLK